MPVLPGGHSWRELTVDQRATCGVSVLTVVVIASSGSVGSRPGRRSGIGRVLRVVRRERPRILRVEEEVGGPEQRPVVEDPVAAAQHASTLAVGIPDEAEPRRNVVRVDRIFAVIREQRVARIFVDRNDSRDRSECRDSA